MYFLFFLLIALCFVLLIPFLFFLLAAFYFVYFLFPTIFEDIFVSLFELTILTAIVASLLESSIIKSLFLIGLVLFYFIFNVFQYFKIYVLKNKGFRFPDRRFFLMRKIVDEEKVCHLKDQIYEWEENKEPKLNIKIKIIVFFIDAFRSFIITDIFIKKICRKIE